MKTIVPSHFRLEEAKRVRLREWHCAVKPYYRSKADYRARLEQVMDRLRKQQEVLRAERRHAVLVIFQGVDASGKDSTIKHVFGGLNPEVCAVHSFTPPSEEELAHDFLWRAVLRLPRRGQVGIFNRSYYEEVLVTKVHPHLLEAERLPPDRADRKALWSGRYVSIADFERHLDRNGTVVIKIFLHLSREEQRKRFLRRIEQARKNWKFDPADIEERARWRDFRKVYEKCLAATHQDAAPWHIVPADDKKNTRLIVAEIVAERLEALGLEYPRPSRKRKRALREIGRKLARDAA